MGIEKKRKKANATKQIGTRVLVEEMERLKEYADTYANGQMALLLRLSLDEFIKNHPLKDGRD